MSAPIFSAVDQPPPIRTFILAYNNSWIMCPYSGSLVGRVLFLTASQLRIIS